MEILKSSYKKHIYNVIEKSKTNNRIDNYIIFIYTSKFQ